MGKTMNKFLYDVVQTIGLPAGHLGDGMPNALFIGSRVLGSTVEEFLPRLLEMECLQICPDQNAGEMFLDAPTGGANLTPNESTSASRATAAIASMQAAADNEGPGIGKMSREQLAENAAQMGIEVPRNAKKADIIQLIEAASAAREKSNGDADLDVNGVTNSAAGGGE